MGNISSSDSEELCEPSPHSSQVSEPISKTEAVEAADTRKRPILETERGISTACDAGAVIEALGIDSRLTESPLGVDTDQVSSSPIAALNLKATATNESTADSLKSPITVTRKLSSTTVDENTSSSPHTQASLESIAAKGSFNIPSASPTRRDESSYAITALAEQYFPVSFTPTHSPTNSLDVFSYHQNYILRDPDTYQMWREIISPLILRDALCGISYMHESGFAHGNICMGSVFLTVDANGVMKATIGVLDTSSLVTKGSPYFYSSRHTMDPQAVEDMDKEDVPPLDSRPGDIWALGILQFNLLKGRDLFYVADPCDPVYARFSSGVSLHTLSSEGDRPSFQTGPCTPEQLEVMEACLCIDRTQRKSASEVLALPWLRNVPAHSS